MERSLELATSIFYKEVYARLQKYIGKKITTELKQDILTDLINYGNEKLELCSIIKETIKYPTIK